MRSQSLRCVAMLLLVIGTAVGCGRSGAAKVKTVPVAGTVTLDDKPLAEANVFFLGAKHVGKGKTGADGKYRLDEGAQPGQNKVYFSKIAGKAATNPEEEVAGAGEIVQPGKASKPAIPAGETIPRKYSDPGKPELTIDVPANGAPAADFKLSSR